MDKIFYWMTAPDTSIAETEWSKFLGAMVAVTIVAILVFTTLSVFFYWRSARARKICSPSDVFRPYTPMRWIILAALGGVIVFGICIDQYLDPTRPRHAIDVVNEALQMGGITALFTAALAYALIAFMPGITPAKFVYRAAPFRAGKTRGQSA